MRKAQLERNTNETQIELEINLDGTGKADHSSVITEYWMHPRSAAVFTGVKR